VGLSGGEAGAAGAVADEVAAGEVAAGEADDAGTAAGPLVADVAAGPD